MPAPAATNRWADAWPDAVAFVVGLALAWWLKWSTTDLVWSLWLSSFCVGYAMILWAQSEPLRETIAAMRADRALGPGPSSKVVVLAILGVIFLVSVAFFTVHFGGFHFVHSAFLNQFFPIAPAQRGQLVDFSVYAEVVRRYWWFLPVAFLAERAAFVRSTRDPDVSVTPQAIAKRKAKGDAMMAPYKNVFRMHLLIFFFAFAHFARLENFAVYAVVYAVYFFPWRLLRASGAAATTG